jgi:hypothetical protein
MKTYGVGRGALNRAAKLARKIEWNNAIRESRVVRFSDGRFKSCLTQEAALAECETAKDAGLDASIVPPSAAQE